MSSRNYYHVIEAEFENLLLDMKADKKFLKAMNSLILEVINDWK